MPDLPRRRALALLALPLLAGVAGCVGRGWTSFDRTTLRIATGNPGGVFVRYGRALTTVLEARLDGVDARARGTDASLENLRLVAEGECDVGFSSATRPPMPSRPTTETSSP